MRVISGSARGLKLNTPVDYDIRPTTDRVKESMFNIIAPYIYDAVVLDLFSGSGALGIEALSRGAKEAYFCDKDPKSISVTKSNIAKAKLEDRSTVIVGDYIKGIKNFSDRNLKADLIFIDPPYYEGLFEEVLGSIISNGILAKDGILLVEHDYNTSINHVDGLKVQKEKKYGKTAVTIFSLEDDDE